MSSHKIMFQAKVSTGALHYLSQGDSAGARYDGAASHLYASGRRSVLYFLGRARYKVGVFHTERRGVKQKIRTLKITRELYPIQPYNFLLLEIV